MDRLLKGMKIGLFGAGHLSRAVASCLLRGGVDEDNVRLCYRGSARTRLALADAGLLHLSATPEDVLAHSDILLYAVRPQECTAIRGQTVSPQALFVSFLAGVNLSCIPVALPEERRVRVMPSTPDTLTEGNAIAGVFPGDNGTALALIRTLGAKACLLRQEAQFHSFTALGPCLPAALALWESLGKVVERAEILALADSLALPDAPAIVEWAEIVRPRNLSQSELAQYLMQAATAGGVTETILSAISDGQTLSESLRCGVRRSQQLGQSATE